ncbi:MFS transporter [Agreia sp. COWG]|uniref:MFS transporter n=1 Tax=Agreia sp. COWG TaxID=2773266 RepID=UPI00192923B8|nr:MFS transporter [Agreia sp. COWG]CAD5989285.1 Inner membrane protein YbjJ [Agreia sp. COWG]
MSTPTSDVAVHPARTLIAWRNAVFVIFVLSGISIATWVARLPTIRDGLELSTANVGVLIFGMSAGSVVGLIVSPAILARFGPRAGIIFCLSVVAGGLVLIGVGGDLASTVTIAFVGLMLFGFGNGAVDVMMNVEGAAAERAIGKTLMPLMHAFFSGGTVLGAGLGAAASGLGVPVFAHLLVMAIIIVVTAVVAVRFIPHDLDAADAASAAENAAPRVPWRQKLAASLAVWADMRLLLIGVVMLGMAFTEGSANDWIAIATVDGHGQSNTTGAIVFGVFVTAMTVGRVAGGPLLDRFGRVPMLRVTAVVGIAGLLLFILSTDFWVTVVGAILWGIGASLGFPVGMSAAADDEKNSAARVSAVAIVGYTAFLAGPPLLGFLGEHFGILNALYVILALLVLSFLASPATRERTYAK